MRLFILTLILALGIATKLCGQDTLYYHSEYSYTQEYIDSLVENFKLRDHHYKALGQILEANDLKGWQWYYLGKGRSYYYEEQLDSSRIALERALDFIYEQDGKLSYTDYACRLRINVALGNVLQDLKLHRQAIQVFQQALSDTEHFHYKWKSYITSGIATNHAFIGNDSIALELTLQISKDSIYMGVPQAGVFNSLILGSLYDAKKDFENAKYYWNKGLMDAESMDYHGYDQSFYMSLADAYLRQDSVDIMLKNYKQAIQAKDQQIPKPFANEQTKKAKGIVAVYGDDVDSGMRLLQEVIDTVKLNGVVNKSDNDLLGSSYSALSFAYQKIGNLKQAILLLHEKNEMLKTFSEFQINEQLQKLEIEYQAKEKDRSISTLTTQNVEQSVTISKQRTQVLISIVLASLLGLIGFLVYRQRGLKAKYKETILQQRLLRTQMDPHFVYNSLNSVSSLVYQKSDMAIPYISKLASLLRLILENSREELVPLEDEITALDSYLSLESNFGNSFKYSIDSGSMETEAFLAPPMLIQPFVENAIKHGFRGIEDPEIKLSISRNASTNLLEVTIVDNGIGIAHAQKNKKHQSVSTSIVRERLAIFGEQHKVETKLEISGVPGQSGTKVFMTIPYFSNN